MIVSVVPRNSLSAGRDWLAVSSIPTLGSSDCKVDMSRIDPGRYRIVVGFGPAFNGSKIVKLLG